MSVLGKMRSRFPWMHNAGANPFEVDGRGYDILELAEQSGRPSAVEAVKMLQQRVCYKTEKGGCPLVWLRTWHFMLHGYMHRMVHMPQQETACGWLAPTASFWPAAAWLCYLAWACRSWIGPLQGSGMHLLVEACACQPDQAMPLFQASQISISSYRIQQPTAASRKPLLSACGPET